MDACVSDGVLDMDAAQQLRRLAYMAGRAVVGELMTRSGAAGPDGFAAMSAQQRASFMQDASRALSEHIAGLAAGDKAALEHAPAAAVAH